MKTTTKFWGRNSADIDIDIRNDRAVACLPGSLYQTKKPEKQKYVGKLYEFKVLDDGTVLDFSHLKPMPLIFREAKRWGLDKATFEPMVPVPKFRKFKNVTAGNS